VGSLFKAILFKVALFIKHFQLHCHQRVVHPGHLAIRFLQSSLLLLVPIDVNWVLVRLIVGVLLVDAQSDGVVVHLGVDEQTEDGRARVVNQVLDGVHVGLHVLDLL